MPGRTRKTKGGKFRNTWGGKVVAKHTSKKKAKAQMRLLHGIEGGWKPTGKKGGRRRRR